MSDYNKATNFTAKDTLPTGNAGKIIKGTEIDTEFTAVASAIASKANINSPTFTGTPAAPLASTGSNTTQIATTSYVKQEITAQGLGNMATQAKSAVDITGGTIVGITDLAVADGGTGSSSITANSVILGNGTSALSGNLVAPGTSGNILKSNGTTWTSAAPTAIKGLGLDGETWHNVMSSPGRTSGSTYTAPAYPIMVSVGGQAVSGSPTMTVVVGGVTINTWAFPYGSGQPITFIVPAGLTYSVTFSAGCTMNYWNELY